MDMKKELYTCGYLHGVQLFSLYKFVCLGSKRNAALIGLYRLYPALLQCQRYC